MSGIGDNSGLFEPADVAKGEIEEAMKPHWDRFKQLDESAGRAAIVDEESAKKVVDLDALFATLMDRVDNTHERIKAPYLDAGRVVDGLANALREKIKPIRLSLGAMLTAWQKAETDRIEAERAKEREAEAADPEPGFTPAPSSARKAARIRGDYGASAHLRDVDTVVIENVKKLPKWILEHADVQAAIAKVAKPVLKAGQTVGGCTLKTDVKSVTKK